MDENEIKQLAEQFEQLENEAGDFDDDAPEDDALWDARINLWSQRQQLLAVIGKKLTQKKRMSGTAVQILRMISILAEQVQDVMKERIEQAAERSRTPKRGKR